jgi:hypothetical protein
MVPLFACAVALILLFLEFAEENLIFAICAA